MKQCLRLSYLPAIYSSGLAGEVDAEFDNSSLIHSERSCVVFCFNLLQGFFCASVQFTFDDVDVVGSLDNNVHSLSES